MTGGMDADPAFGSCRFRIPLGGRRAIWEVTNACNYGCRYCIFASTGRVPPGELDGPRAMAVLGELAAAGFTHVKFTGGEPFLRTDMADLLERARDLGMACDVSTNASLIDGPLASRLAGLGLEMVHVSLDGPDAASHEAVRGRRTFAPTMEGLARLLDAGAPVRVGCVVHALNEDRLAEMAALCSRLGVGTLALSRMEPAGRMRGRPSLLCSLDDDALRARVDDAARLAGGMAVTHNLDRPGGCGACPGGDRFAFIDHKGRVSPCTWVSEHRPSLAAGPALAESPLAEILAGPGIARYRAGVAAYASTGREACPMSDADAFDGAVAALPPGPGRFERAYAFSTENLSYVADVVRPGDAVLSVAGSGDHAVMACAAGAARVLAVDVNPAAVMWAQVKLAALATLDRPAFVEFTGTGRGALGPDPARAIARRLPPGPAAFLEALLARHGGEGPAARASGTFREGDVPPSRYVPYLADDRSYRDAAAAVARAAVSFAVADLRDLTSLPDKAVWDAILLSNVAEHSHRMFGAGHVTAFRDAVAAPLARTLRPGGRLAMYVFDAADRRGSSARNPYGHAATRAAAYGAIPGTRLAELAMASALDDAGPDDADAASVLTRLADA